MSSKTGFIMGGLLSGIGQGIVAQGQQSAAERREIALQNLRGQQAREQADANHKIKMTEMQTDADLRDRNDSRSNERKTSSTIIVDNNKAGNAQTLERLKAGNDASLERLKSSLSMSRTQAELAQKLANDVTLAGKEAGEFRVKADGTMVVLAKNGTVLNKSEPGAFIPTGQRGGDDDSGGTISGALAGRNGTQPPPPPQAKPAPPADPQWYAPNYTPSSDTQPSRTPRAGDVIDGYRFNGGDASNPKNWTKVK